MMVLHCGYCLFDYIRKNDKYSIWIIVLFSIIGCMLANILYEHITGYNILSDLEFGIIILTFIVTISILVILTYFISYEMCKVDENIIITL